MCHVGVIRGKTYGKLPNGRTDWHHTWNTCSDLSGNGPKLNKMILLDPRGACGGIWGQQLKKKSENLPNGWTEWHQISHTYADSCGNGHNYAKNKLPLDTPWGNFDVLGGQKVQVWENYETDGEPSISTLYRSCGAKISDKYRQYIMPLYTAFWRPFPK